MKKRGLTGLAAGFLMLCAVAISAPMSASADWGPNMDTWIKKDGSLARNEWIDTGYAHQWFDKDAKLYDRQGLFKLGKDLYWLGYRGAREENTERTTHDGDTYYFGKDGKAYRNRTRTEYRSVKYYKGSGKKAKNEWITIKKQKYWFDQWGNRAQNGWEKAKNDYYYFLSNGKYEKNKWIYDRYCMSDGRRAVKRILKVGKYRYYFDKDGYIERWKLLKTKKGWFYFDADGHMVGNKGVEIDGYKYWFKSDGRMARNETVKGKGTEVRFDKNGRISSISGKKAGWVTKDWIKHFNNGLYEMGNARFRWNGHVYLVRYGRQMRGRNNWEDGTYFLDEKHGYIRTGWISEPGEYHKVNGRYVQGPREWRYYNPKGGKMRTGLVKIGKYRYFLDWETGVRRTGRHVVKKNPYLFNKDGKMQAGWINWKGKRYYADPKTGILKKGWATINGKRYYFSPKTNALVKRG